MTDKTENKKTNRFRSSIDRVLTALSYPYFRENKDDTAVEEERSTSLMQHVEGDGFADLSYEDYPVLIRDYVELFFDMSEEEKLKNRYDYNSKTYNCYDALIEKLDHDLAQTEDPIKKEFMEACRSDWFQDKLELPAKLYAINYEACNRLINSLETDIKNLNVVLDALDYLSDVIKNSPKP